MAEGAAGQKPDIVCLPEGISVVGTGRTYADVSETIPGPTTQRLGQLAQRLHSYVVAGIYERNASVIYNTAVLIGRNGEFVGKYRKTHLPYEEVDGGITPGDSYPVFSTDFGKVGLMVCWDVQFPEPARALAAQGAEIILLPIWGGSEVLARARAIENHIFLVSSSYDMRTFIVNPAGSVLAEATSASPVAVAEIRLDRKILQPWLGDMKPRTWKERRTDLKVP
jgi:predicted amidohydrolase